MAMRLHERRWYPYVAAVAIVAVWATWFYVKTLGTPEFLFFGLGSVAAIAHFFYQQHLATTQFFGELFTRFNLRYDGLNDKLSRILLGRKNAKLTPREREILQDYFNLCAEEWFYFRAGYIDARVWQFWLNGMAQFVADEEIRKFWEEECESDSYYAFPFKKLVERWQALRDSGKLKPLLKRPWELERPSVVPPHLTSHHND